MKIKVLFFGRLAEMAGRSDLEIEDIRDTNALSSELQQRYPTIANMKYLIAIDKSVITGNQKLEDNMTIALLPPFSGG